MRFSGGIRVPGIDQIGFPAVFLIDDNYIEVVLEGDSLGRWSLYDVRAWRLVSSAFQVDLAGEEITFHADDPTDFAYRGLEHMAEVWARYKSMNIAARRVAVRRARKGVTPSKISALRDAMLENRAFELNEFPTGNGSDRSDDSTAEPIAQETESLAVNDLSALLTTLRLANDSPDQSVSAQIDRDGEFHRPDTVRSESLEREKRALDEERARLEAEIQSLEAERLEAEELEAARVEAFQLEMERLESELEDQQRLEAERSEASRQELESLQAELVETERLVERKELEHLESERLELARAQSELEQTRAELERIGAERAKAARSELASIEKRRKAIERLDNERAERERLDSERRKSIETEMEQLRAKLAEDLAPEAVVVEEQGAEADEAEGAAEVTSPDLVEELVSASGGRHSSSGDTELVVDLGDFEEPDAESESSSTKDSPLVRALVGAHRKDSAVLGAVKGVLGRNGRNHVHELVEAPGGNGIGRSVCAKCGYVSISASE